MWITIGVGIAVHNYSSKELLITSFSIHFWQKRWGCQSILYHYLLMILLTLAAVTAMQSVGTHLIGIAMLITPAATAYLYANSLKTMTSLSSS